MKARVVWADATWDRYYNSPKFLRLFGSKKDAIEFGYFNPIAYKITIVPIKSKRRRKK